MVEQTKLVVPSIHSPALRCFSLFHSLTLSQRVVRQRAAAFDAPTLVLNDRIQGGPFSDWILRISICSHAGHCRYVYRTAEGRREERCVED